MGFFLRWLFAFGLLSATFNPTEWNFVAWARRAWAQQTSVVVLIGLLLAIAYIVYLRATVRSIGAFGMMLVLAVVAALIWVLHDAGFIALNNPSMNLWIGILALSIVLGVGLSWSHVRRALSGQSDIDDVDE